MTTEKLLREYVRQVLKEDEGYGEVFAAAADMNPFGMSFGSNEDLYNIFVRPFTDVLDTAAGKTKEISQRAQTLLHVAFEAVATSLIPVLKDSYSEIFEHEKEVMDKIKEEYGEVYKANFDAFKDHDVMFAAFCYDPAKFMTRQLINKSPKVAIGLISTLTGGTIDSWLDKVKAKFGLDKDDESVKTGLERDPKKGGQKFDTGHDYGGGGGDMGFGMGMEGLVREDDEGKRKPDIADVLLNPKVMAKLQQSDVVQKMQREASAAVRGALEQVYKQASGVAKANSLQDLQNKTGVKLKGMDKLQQVPQEERQKAEQLLLQGAKKGMKSFYVQQLEGQVKKAIADGAPKDSAYVSDFQRVIGKLKAL